MLPVSLKRELRPGRGRRAQVWPPVHVPGAQGWLAACGWSWAPSGGASSHLKAGTGATLPRARRGRGLQGKGVWGETVGAGVPSLGPGGWDGGPRAPAVRRGPWWRPQ